ncbi:hypothetical protein [Pelagibius marinus]|uniref:hypothetical protein n=1 Tax=Pelagibius marinus TaxID=2762760 RepID=UPI00221F9D21|nr:hypothetical protein [Pelagibius marinus]
MAADLPPPSDPAKRYFLPAQGHRLYGALGSIVVDLQDAMIEVRAQLLHPR